jgi:DNA-binding response OmpR family regulator
MKVLEKTSDAELVHDRGLAVSSMGRPRVFVVEDEVLLALSLEDDLREAGFSMLGPYTTLANALLASRHESFDLALLDVNLHGEAVFPLADELLVRNIPVVLLTGYGAADLPERFRALPRLQKPYEPTLLVRELRRTARID